MIELKSLCAGYGDREILHGVSATFERGKLTAVIGPNGSGKTTLQKTVAALLPIRAGTVTVDGSDLSAMKQKERARRIAYLPQGREIPDMTVEQMVLHGRFAHLSFPRVYTEGDRAAARQAMEQMGIAEWADRELGTLSGGMRQNVYLAMALAQNSDYILLDEPTTYLDIANRLQLMTALRRLAKEGKGIVAVLHDLPLAMSFAHEIAVMREGRLLTQASPDALFASGLVDEVFGAKLVRIANGGSYGYDFSCESGGQ